MYIYFKIIKSRDLDVIIPCLWLNALLRSNRLVSISRLPPWLKRIRQRRVQSRGLIVCNQLQQKQAFICYKRLYFESEVLSFGLLDKEKCELRERICWWDWYNGLQQNLDLAAPHDGLWTSCYHFSLVVASFIILSDSHGKSSCWYKSFFFFC